MYFYSHIWKSFIRNERWRRNIFTRIMYVFISIYFILTFFILGNQISASLAKSSGDAVASFNAYMIWYLVADLLIRCILQPIPSLDVIPYFRFRIRRNKIINHLLVRSAFNLFNILPLFLIMPFALKVLIPLDGTTAGLLYITGCLLLLIFNNYFALLVGYLAKANYLYYLIPLGIAGAMGLIHKSGIQLESISSELGRVLSEGNPYIFAGVAGMITAVIWLTRIALQRNLYIDRTNSKRENRSAGSFFSGVFSGLGDTGRYMSLEIAMISRNKRPRNTMLMVPFFLAYFIFMFLSKEEFNDQLITIVITTMLIGLGSVSYGQLIFSWESTYFDGIMARRKDFTSYLRAKVYLQAILSVIIFIPMAIVIAISGKLNMFLLVSLFLFHLGANSFLVMLLALLNDGRLNLNDRTFMNYQGVKGSQFLLTMLFISLPIGIFKLLQSLVSETAGIITIALIGLLFILSHEWWLKNIISTRFKTRKYKSLEGFRKLST